VIDGDGFNELCHEKTKKEKHKGSKYLLIGFLVAINLVGISVFIYVVNKHSKKKDE